MKKLGLEKFITFVDIIISNMDSALREAGEMQLAFTSEYVNRHKAETESMAAAYVDRIAKIFIGGKYDRGNPYYSALSAKVGQISARLGKLRDELASQITKLEGDIESIRSGHQAIVKKFMKMNPEYDAREENEKMQLASLEGNVRTLSDNIRTLKSGFGFITNYFTIRELRRRLDEKLVSFNLSRASLDGIRREFYRTKTDKEAEEKKLEERYREAVAKLSYARESHARLSGDFDAACVVEAASETFREFDEKALRGLSGDVADMEKFVAMMKLSNDYEKGLKSAAEEIGFLTGVRSGLLNIRKTLESLLAQYNSYSQYLKPLSFDVPPECEKFSEAVSSYAKKIVDDKALGLHPGEYLKIVEPFHADTLNEAGVKKMFEKLGDAITAAAAAWK